MPEGKYGALNKILGVSPEVLKSIPKAVLEKVVWENERIIDETLSKINSSESGATHVRGVLRRTIFYHEKQFRSVLETMPGKDEFEKAAYCSRKIAKVGGGFFLKKDLAKEILEKRPPHRLLEYLGLKNVKELLNKHDVAEIFSALRFVESDEWMHQTFEEAYSHFTAKDFEEREIEIKVLGPAWRGIGEKFVAKKHHNVSHLKEFGVIFLNPIHEEIPGKFLRDFALLLHYFHEIDFYSRLFRRYAGQPDFSSNLKALLRGDVKKVDSVSPGEWLVVQQYLVKQNPNDPRLFLPRINPESIHWARGERDLADFFKDKDHVDLELWHDLEWVGGIFNSPKEDILVSFDLEDNAMSLVSFMEGKEEFFIYHQREAMWTRIFSELVGGEAKMDQLLMENFNKGTIKI